MASLPLRQWLQLNLKFPDRVMHCCRHHLLGVIFCIGFSLTFLAAPAVAAAATADSASMTANAGPLRWEQQRADLRLKAGEKTASAIFTFVNTGAKPVRITSVESSCGCTAGKPDREEYAPGERGELRAEFNAGSRRGVQSNWIDVRTDAGGEPVRLEFVVVIPDPLTATPRMLTWAAATEIARDTTIPKTTRLHFDRLETGRIERVEATPEADWLRAEAVPPAGDAGVGVAGETPDANAGDWILSVTPSWHEAALPWRSAVTVTAHTEKLGPLKLRIFVVCR
ncbi:DUF1573 domain-containing protein [Geminisphaera colitermitum]|uniref:DUF1573 domain-containing protein n=1 Tax=Geminisphaera colitermitum TaxID=1148786 RepID=UPI000158CF10|nr:DUF1573 domain-containing protein [Geminisphaera colitermitum]